MPTLLDIYIGPLSLLLSFFLLVGLGGIGAGRVAERQAAELCQTYKVRHDFAIWPKWVCFALGAIAIIHYEWTFLWLFERALWRSAKPAQLLVLPDPAVEPASAGGGE